ncbi:MAG: hypothetical protein ACFNYI_00945 [Eubacterium sp.]
MREYRTSFFENQDSRIRLLVRVSACLISLLAVLLLCCGCGTQSSAEDTSSSSNKSAVKGFVSSHCHEQQMRKRGAVQYAQIYIMAEGLRRRGLMPRQAFMQASEAYMASMALSEEARKQGIHVTKSELDSYITKMVSDMKTNGIYKDVQKEAVRHGTTVRGILKGNRDVYQKQIAVSKLYQKERKEYLQAVDQTTAAEQKAWDKKWGKIQKSAVDKYRKSPEGSKIQKRLPQMRKVYCSKYRDHAGRAYRSEKDAA